MFPLLGGRGGGITGAVFMAQMSNLLKKPCFVTDS
jgi:hypothetical protein